MSMPGEAKDIIPSFLLYASISFLALLFSHSSFSFLCLLSIRLALTFYCSYILFLWLFFSAIKYFFFYIPFNISFYFDCQLNIFHSFRVLLLCYRYPSRVFTISLSVILVNILFHFFVFQGILTSLILCMNDFFQILRILDWNVAF